MNVHVYIVKVHMVIGAVAESTYSLQTAKSVHQSVSLVR